ncbi:hypothetical protein GALMADRAFT_220938 [Galerina marginata CBS 339.88]|uniref:BED-type domain-containing protein n=1 Tax=Galerina marginata (strain CBS 339.88) TaxID=685588 RepID=A0A067TSU4_GALM3|nr:hypothetical protein GALMADRAFT_220938 [Galerina marginata CBS 339.88]
MPRTHKRYNAVLKNPVEQTSFQGKSGTVVYHKIYAEVGTNKALVQCDVCDLYFPLQADRSVTNLRIHLRSAECKKEKKGWPQVKLDIQAMLEDDREGRKRGMSEVSASTTYSESR